MTKLASLQSKFFLFVPRKFGQLGFAIERRCSWRLNRYRAEMMWTSWQWLWLRVYWWDGEKISAGFGSPVEAVAGNVVHGEIPHWLCVECSAIQPWDGNYPDSCWSCASTLFIRDSLPPLFRESKGTDSQGKSV